MAEENLTLKTVAVTGHRTLEALNEQKLEEVFKQLIKKGYNRYLVGMAVGFDTVCFKILEGLREKHDIKIIACIPCKDQAKYFTEAQKVEYERMIKAADEKRIFSEKYTSYCMHRRNCYMVDKASVIVAYLRKSFGGTYNTVKYAEKQGKTIVHVE